MKERASEKKVLEEGLTVLGQGCIQRKIKVRVLQQLGCPCCSLFYNNFAIHVVPCLQQLDHPMYNSIFGCALMYAVDQQLNFPLG